MPVRFSMRWLIVPVVSLGIYAIVMADPQPMSDMATSDSAFTDPQNECDDPELLAENRELDILRDSVNSRIVLKERLVKDLIDGRTDLERVASEFNRMNELEPQCKNMVVTAMPGNTIEEKYAANVIEYVRTRVSKEQATSVMERLKKEFQQLHGHQPVVMQ